MGVVKKDGNVRLFFVARLSISNRKGWEERTEKEEKETKVKAA